jgi:hypothetical protein
VVWEESIIQLPDTVRMLFLSATIPNAKGKRPALPSPVIWLFDEVFFGFRVFGLDRSHPQSAMPRRGDREAACASAGCSLTGIA